MKTNSESMNLKLQILNAESDLRLAALDVKKANERFEHAKTKYDTLKDALAKLANPKPTKK